jgi:hypothetical protein
MQFVLSLDFAESGARDYDYLVVVLLGDGGLDVGD